MTRSAVIAVDTTLHHPIEGAYTFPAGSPDPGGLWTERPGGEPIGKNVAAETLKALAEAEVTIERLNQQAMRLSHDVQQRAEERDAANARAAEAEREAEAAKSEAAQAKAEFDAVVLERDAARSEAAKMKASAKPAKSAE